MAKDLTQKRLSEVLEYNKETGDFFWKVSLAKIIKIGDKAGSFCHGYLQTGIDCSIYANHHLAWLYVYGLFPEKDLDHIDGNKANNAILNLRYATKSQNSHNVGITKRNKSGIKGVCWYKAGKKWAAQIRIKNKKIHLGYFDDIKNAKMIVEKTREKLLKEFSNHGSVA